MIPPYVWHSPVIQFLRRFVDALETTDTRHSFSHPTRANISRAYASHIRNANVKYTACLAAYTRLYDDARPEMCAGYFVAGLRFPRDKRCNGRSLHRVASPVLSRPRCVSRSESSAPSLYATRVAARATRIIRWIFSRGWTHTTI